ncbi:MAG: M56 family metallopeptidase [Ruminococcaceae bacterium]|nr:M56 family metallopeptidase [Oscillospiraceae bacterium]
MNINRIFDFVLTSSVHGSIVGFIIFLVSKFTNKIIPYKFKTFLWSIFIIKIFLPNGPESKVSVFNEQFFYNANNFKEIVLDNMGTSVHTGTSNLNIFPLIWFLGFIIICLWLLISNVILNIKLKTYHKPVNERIYNIFNNCKKNMKVKREIILVNQSFVKSVSLFGLFFPKILITDKLQNYEDREIEYVFYHELSHYKRKDIFVNYLVTFIQVIHWFNPVIHIITKFIREDIEFSTDENTLAKIKPSEHKRYGLLLISMLEEYSKTFTPKILNVVDSEKQIKKRIKRITSYKESSIFSIIILVFLIISLSFLTLTTGVCEESVETIVENITAVEKNIHTYQENNITKKVKIPKKEQEITKEILKEESTTEHVEELNTSYESVPVKNIQNPEATTKSLLPGTDINILLNDVLSTGKSIKKSSFVDLRDYCTIKDYSIKENESVVLGTYIPDSKNSISIYLNSDNSQRINIMLLKNSDMVINASVKPSKTNLYLFTGLNEGEKYELLLVLKPNSQYTNYDTSGSILIF